MRADCTRTEVSLPPPQHREMWMSCHKVLGESIVVWSRAGLGTQSWIRCSSRVWTALRYSEITPYLLANVSHVGILYHPTLRKSKSSSMLSRSPRKESPWPSAKSVMFKSLDAHTRLGTDSVSIESLLGVGRMLITALKGVWFEHYLAFEQS